MTRDVLGEAVMLLCAAGANAWARGDEPTALRAFVGARRLVAGGEYLELCPDGDCDDPIAEPEVEQRSLFEGDR